ncbi:MAG: hypothetical protein NTY03_03570 [Candidatus Bathyarchaeota archaeon]|nr:hypothetical protein [Candidatus Bathyarchaeota archaeon]
MSNSSRTTLTALISCILTITAFLPHAMNSPLEAPTSSLEWKLTYRLTTDNETYHAPAMIEASIMITKRNPYPMNFAPPSPFIYSGGYIGEEKKVTNIKPDWVIGQVPADSTIRLTTMRFSAAKAGYFEITWRTLRVVVKVVNG